MESKIKRIEELIEEQEAAYAKAIDENRLHNAHSCTYTIGGLKEAIRILKEPSNTQMQVDAPIIRCAGCGCILNDPLCVDCGELPPAHD